jgi:hypothetical protein
VLGTDISLGGELALIAGDHHALSRSMLPLASFELSGG